MTSLTSELDGVVPLRMADFTYPHGHPLADQRGVVFAFAIRHPDGVLLVDTGIGHDHRWVEEAFRPQRRPIRGALATVGVGLDDVVAVANTHLHFDHCGQNHVFPRVPIYVQRAERENARHPGYTIPEWVDFPEARYELLDGDAEPLTGVRLIATPGHTAGHQSVAVATRDGIVLLPGHAVFSAAEWEVRAEADSASDEATRSVQLLRELLPRRVLFSHDETIWERRP